MPDSGPGVVGGHAGQPDGAVRDFVASGDVDIKVIGADGPILDSETPVRQILEQLVARTGVPPFLLGLSWSSTERMSSQQADILTSELTSIRRTLEPVVERVCELWLELHGYDRRCQMEWADINLQDEVDEAKALLYRQPGPGAEHRRESGMRNITKQADVQGLGQAGLGDLEQINALARRELTADEVYLFAVRLCDNDVDRDGERFAVETLEELGKLFVGCPGCSTTSGPPGDRLPGSIAPRWCTRRER